MHGCRGRPDKDGAERRAQLARGRKRARTPVVDDRRAEAGEEAATGSRRAGRGNLRERMEATDLSSDVDHFDGATPVPPQGEKGQVPATVERYRLEFGENTDAAENDGRLHARRGDRSQLALVGEEHAGCPPAAGQRGDEGDAAFVVHDRGRALAEAGDQLTCLVRNRIASDRNGRDLSVGLGEEYPLLRLAPPDGGVERGLAPVVGG